MRQRRSIGHCDHAEGFTLLELMVVMALLALVAGILTSHVSRENPQDELRSTTQLMASGMRLARNRAIRLNEEVPFVVDVDSRSFFVGDKKQQFSRKLTLKIIMADDEQLSDSRAGIRFYPDGSSSGGRIYVESSGRKAGLEVEWLTGRIRFLK